MTETSQRYRRLAGILTERVHRVPAGRWDAPSPCAGWTARDVLRHVVEAHHTFAGNGGLKLPDGPSVDDDPARAWEHVRDALQELLDDPDRADTEYRGYHGTTTVAASVGAFLCFDLIVHGWDIARATGTDETIPAADIDDAFAFAEQLGDNLRLPGVCGPVVDVPADADPQTRLLGLLGRRP